ncbi:MAG: hypothetical protein CMI71_01235 [Candidatus Pelagibacter sp.]|nr:hypothetical protein [Candidatus Pelagibacter sp.]
MIEIIFLIFVIILILELSIKNFALIIRKKFQWMIVDNVDEIPVFKKDLIKKFKDNSFNYILGWDNKKNSSRNEEVKSVGELRNEKFKKVFYSFDKLGARNDKNNEKKRKLYTSFGDSFVFCKHVKNNETWQNELSKLTKSYVTNYGVNNFGIDQALIKYKLKKDNSKIVFLGFVPETIIRIHSSWKHYSEYGNILGFKPKFEWKKNKLTLIKNNLKRPDDLLLDEKVKKIINLVKKKDLWYKNKFSNDVLKFPFVFQIFKNLKRNFSIFFFFIFFFLTKKNYFYNLAWKTVLAENFKLVLSCYKLEKSKQLLLEIINQFIREVKKNKSIPIIIIFPYKQDLDYLKKNKRKYYVDVINKFKSKTKLIDLSDTLVKKRYSSYYNSNYFGSHLTKSGNKICAKIIFNYLKKI